MCSSDLIMDEVDPDNRRIVESPYANDERRHRRPSVFVRPEEGFDAYAGRVLPRPIIDPDFQALGAGGVRYSFSF